MTEIETHLFASSIKLTRLGLGQMKYKVKKANIEMMKVHICIDIVNNMHVNSFRIIGSKGNIRAVIAKEKGKTNFKFSSSMRDTGTLILNIRHSIPGSPKASRRQIYLYFATQQHSKALEQRYGRDHRGHREGHTELPS